MPSERRTAVGLDLYALLHYGWPLQTASLTQFHTLGYYGENFWGEVVSKELNFCKQRHAILSLWKIMLLPWWDLLAVTSHLYHFLLCRFYSVTYANYICLTVKPAIHVHRRVQPRLTASCGAWSLSLLASLRRSTYLFGGKNGLSVSRATKLQYRTFTTPVDGCTGFGVLLWSLCLGWWIPHGCENFSILVLD